MLQINTLMAIMQHFCKTNVKSTNNIREDLSTRRPIKGPKSIEAAEETSAYRDTGNKLFGYK
jgi:hypothetical protein